MLSVLHLVIFAAHRMVNGISLRWAASWEHLNVDASGYSRCIACNACNALSARLLHFIVG